MKTPKKILIVGYGSIGKRHAENLISNFNVKLIIYTKRKDLDFKNKNILVYDSLDKCLAEEPDIGFITNETKFHLPVAIKLARHGLDLFLEKPLSDSLHQIDLLQKLIKQKKLITQMGCNWRFHPCISKIKKIVEKNSLGKIITIHVENNSYLPDWHPWENYRTGYSANKKLGGGIVLTQIHELDYMYWFLGSVKEVSSITGHFSNLEISADDTSVNLLTFQNKTIGELHLDFFQRPDFKSCKIRGTKGVLYWDTDTNYIKIYNSRKQIWEIKFKPKNYKKNSMYVDELTHFMKCVDQRKQTINDLSQGIKTLKIALSIIKSSKLKKTIKVLN